jgi:hypothetical protein
MSDAKCTLALLLLMTFRFLRLPSAHKLRPLNGQWIDPTNQFAREVNQRLQQQGSAKYLGSIVQERPGFFKSQQIDFVEGGALA